MSTKFPELKIEANRSMSLLAILGHPTQQKKNSNYSFIDLDTILVKTVPSIYTLFYLGNKIYLRRVELMLKWTAIVNVCDPPSNADNAKFKTAYPSSFVRSSINFSAKVNCAFLVYKKQRIYYQGLSLFDFYIPHLIRLRFQGNRNKLGIGILYVMSLEITHTDPLILDLLFSPSVGLLTRRY